MHHRVRKKTGSADEDTQQSSPSTDSYERTLLSWTNLLWCGKWEADTTCTLDTHNSSTHCWQAKTRHELVQALQQAETSSCHQLSQHSVVEGVSVVVTGTGLQVATRYESTFASVYILLKPFCQLPTRTWGGGRVFCGVCGLFCSLIFFYRAKKGLQTLSTWFLSPFV